MRDRTCDMQRKRTARIETCRAHTVEIRGVQELRRSAWVGQVEHDQIEAVRCRTYEVQAVTDLEFEPRIVQRSAVDRAEILARDVDDRAIDFDQRDRLDRRMLEEFLGRSAVTAADD